MTSLFLTQNISFYTIPIAWVLALAPHTYATQLYESKSKKQFDLTQPRGLTAKLAGDQTINQATKDKIIRAEGAQSNGFENIGLFAAAVVAGNMANLDAGYMNALSLGYVASRIVYTFVYLNNSSIGQAQGRSLIFLTGVGLCMTMFVSAGRNLGG
ncbi:hypothetical protein OEA41_002362 [Lepraria neglecta]|uniref:Uncharacterized protein n=1 Tax=Lepraria neglecta TaxID=209136 RepID=A0AAD9ZBE6_9LECA|nr:hypothetical protein OEA41_002362 [Lepraria neglecta]